MRDKLAKITNDQIEQYFVKNRSFDIIIIEQGYVQNS